MADIQFDITLDLVEKYVPAENVTVVQEDYQSVKFVYTILNREQPVDLSGATDIVVSFVKPDGHIVLQNDGALVNGKIELVANPQAFTYVGKTYFQVQYKIGSSIYNTRQAFLWVERGNTSCQTLSSTDFAPMLDQAIQAGQMLAGIDLQALIDSKVTAENAQADVDALELRVGALEVTIVGLDSRVDTLEVSQAAQDTAISGISSSVGTLSTEVDSLQLTAVDHETRIDGLEANMPNLDPINTAITTLQAKDVEQDGRIGANEIAISAVQTKNTQQDTAIAGNATEIANLQAEQTTQNNRLTAVENKNAAQDSAIGDIQVKNTQQDTAISALQSSQATQDTDIAAIKTKNTEQDTAISANSTSIVTVDNKVTANKSEQDTVNSGVAGSLSNHSTRIEALEADATIDDARITNLEGDNTSNKNRISNVEGAIGVLNSDINDLQGSQAVQDTRLNAIEAKNSNQDIAILDNSAAIAANKTDADSKITGLTTRLGTAETDIVNLKVKDTQQDTRMTAIENKNDSQDTRMTDIETKNSQQDSRMSTIESDVSSVKADYIKKGNNQNSGTSSSNPFLEIASSGASSALHLTNAPGFTAPYILGVGKDFEGNGIELPNKANGNMITGTQRDTVTDPNSYWLKASQQSTTSPLVRLEQNATNSAVALQLVANGTPTDTQTLMYVGDSLGEAIRVYAKDGGMKFYRNLEMQDRTATAHSKIRLQSHSGAPEDQRHNLFVDKQGLDWYNYSGSPGRWYPFSVRASGNKLNLSAGPLANSVGGGTLTAVAEVTDGSFNVVGSTNLVKKTGDTLTGQLDIQIPTSGANGVAFKNTTGGDLHKFIGTNTGAVAWQDRVNNIDVFNYSAVNKMLTFLGDTNLLKKTGDRMSGDLLIDRPNEATHRNLRFDTNGTADVSIGLNTSGKFLAWDQVGGNGIWEYDKANKVFNVLAPNTNLMKKTDYTAKDGRASLTLTADATNKSESFLPLVSRRGNTATVRMGITRNIGSTNSLVTTLPADMRPVDILTHNVLADDGTRVALEMRVNGEIHVYTAGKGFSFSATYVVD